MESRQFKFLGFNGNGTASGPLVGVLPALVQLVLSLHIATLANPPNTFKLAMIDGILAAVGWLHVGEFLEFPELKEGLLAVGTVGGIIFLFTSVHSEMTWVAIQHVTKSFMVASVAVGVVGHSVGAPLTRFEGSQIELATVLGWSLRGPGTKRGRKGKAGGQVLKEWVLREWIQRQHDNNKPGCILLLLLGVLHLGGLVLCRSFLCLLSCCLRLLGLLSPTLLVVLSRSLLRRSLLSRSWSNRSWSNRSAIHRSCSCSIHKSWSFSGS